MYEINSVNLFTELNEKIYFHSKNVNYACIVKYIIPENEIKYKCVIY